MIVVAVIACVMPVAGLAESRPISKALRRLPPQIEAIDSTVVPSSLLYRNDSLDTYLAQSASIPEQEIIRIAGKTTTDLILDDEGEAYRDTCI